jgi:hypothetical protein
MWIKVPGGYKPGGTVGFAAVPEVGQTMNLNREGVPLRFTIEDVSADTMDVFVEEIQSIVRTDMEEE